VPSQATVHRALVRNGLVTAQEQHHPRRYKRWQRETPMHLWQMDLVGGLYLADGREFKLLTGIDDHSRFVVIATVLAVPNGRAVCEAFTEAMRRYGVPSEVLTDNGKQFTGRFTKPRPAEVLFERVCREHGITALLTKPSSPTTTGKIERWHQTLRRELLDEAGPFTDLPAAQATIDAWVHAYNQARPHQALAMATPASLFQPRHHDPQALTVAPVPEPAPEPVVETPAAPLLLPAGVHGVEFDTVIAASGLLSVLPRVQRIKMGPERAGQRAHVWADENSVHVLIDGKHVKTVTSALSTEDLHELRLRGATPAGPRPATGVPRNRPLPGGTVIDVDRTVDASGVIGLGGHDLPVGAHLAGQRDRGPPGRASGPRHRGRRAGKDPALTRPSPATRPTARRPRGHHHDPDPTVRTHAGRTARAHRRRRHGHPPTRPCRAHPRRQARHRPGRGHPLPRATRG